MQSFEKSALCKMSIERIKKVLFMNLRSERDQNLRNMKQEDKNNKLQVIQF